MLSIDYSIISILAYFLLLIGIGFYAMKHSTSNNSEYLLGGRQVGPQVTALSAGASDMSGWMLLGLPGAAYSAGFDSVWLAIGLVIGAYVNYQLVAPRLRVYTELANDSLTIPEFLSQRFLKDKSIVRLVASAVIILFFTVYTASGLVAGGKLFATAFSADYQVGVIATVSIVVLYTIMGGFLAVSLTDFVQGIIMLMALVAVPIVAYLGIPESSSGLSLSAQISAFEFNSDWLAMLALLSWGLGYFGQPHIIVRFMAISSHTRLPQARMVGINWMIVSIVGALMTGIVGFLYIKSTGAELKDPETIFIHLSQVLFHPLIAGWLLAAILAAVMSTISSQLLVSSSSLVEDVYKVYFHTELDSRKALLISRLCVLAVACCATAIALSGTTGVLKLVSSAWAGFGATFGPVILFSLWWKSMTERAALAGIVTGAVTVMFWGYAPILSGGKALSYHFYELLPAFVLSSVAIWVVGRFSSGPCKKTVSLYDRTAETVG